MHNMHVMGPIFLSTLAQPGGRDLKTEFFDYNYHCETCVGGVITRTGSDTCCLWAPAVHTSAKICDRIMSAAFWPFDF